MSDTSLWKTTTLNNRLVLILRGTQLEKVLKQGKVYFRVCALWITRSLMPSIFPMGPLSSRDEVVSFYGNGRRRVEERDQQYLVTGCMEGRTEVNPSLELLAEWCYGPIYVFICGSTLVWSEIMSQLLT